MCSVVANCTQVLVHGCKRLVILSEQIQNKIVRWYHYYLLHPGENKLEVAIVAVMWWHDMRPHIRKRVKYCKQCQLGKRCKCKYGHLQAKVAEIIPWNHVCVDLVDPYTIKADDDTVSGFMRLTMIDPVTGWSEIVQLHNRDVTHVRKGDREEITKVIINKTSECVELLFNKSWLSCYPRAYSIIYNNGREFKLFFESLCELYSLKRKPTTIQNPQSNAILDRVYQVVTNMMRTSSLDMQ